MLFVESRNKSLLGNRGGGGGGGGGVGIMNVLKKTIRLFNTIIQQSIGS